MNKIIHKLHAIMKKTLFLAILLMLLPIVSDAQSLADVSPVARDSVFLRLRYVDPTSFPASVKRIPAVDAVAAAFDGNVLTFQTLPFDGVLTVYDVLDGSVVVSQDVMQGENEVAVLVSRGGDYKIEYACRFMRFVGYLDL